MLDSGSWPFGGGSRPSIVKLDVQPGASGCCIATATDCTSVFIPWVFALTITPQANGSGNYVIAANSAQCDGVTINHTAITAASVAALATALTNDPSFAALGTWTVSSSNILYVGECQNLQFTWST